MDDARWRPRPCSACGTVLERHGLLVAAVWRGPGDELEVAAPSLALVCDTLCLAAWARATQHMAPPRGGRIDPAARAARGGHA